MLPMSLTAQAFALSNDQEGWIAGDDIRMCSRSWPYTTSGWSKFVPTSRVWVGRILLIAQSLLYHTYSSTISKIEGR
jgi:hypothetical protein